MVFEPFSNPGFCFNLLNQRSEKAPVPRQVLRHFGALDEILLKPFSIWYQHFIVWTYLCYMMPLLLPEVKASLITATREQNCLSWNKIKNKWFFWIIPYCMCLILSHELRRRATSYTVNKRAGWLHCRYSYFMTVERCVLSNEVRGDKS